MQVKSSPLTIQVVEIQFLELHSLWDFFFKHKIALFAPGHHRTRHTEVKYSGWWYVDIFLFLVDDTLISLAWYPNHEQVRCRGIFWTGIIIAHALLVFFPPRMLIITIYYYVQMPDNFSTFDPNILRDNFSTFDPNLFSRRWYL